MSAPEFTDTGLSIQTYEEIYAEIASSLQEIYGDINLDSNTPDGQRVGITAKVFFDLQVFVLSLYNGLDKYLATGEQLKIIGKISGIRPTPALQSAWNLDVTATESFELPVTFTIKDSNGYVWSPEKAVILAAATQSVRFNSGSFGDIPGTAGETFVQDTVEPSITSIVAVEDATPGVAEVTDEAYRKILRESVENPSYSTRGKMLAAIYQISGVTNLSIHENSSNTTDSTGTLAHTLWCIIEGGADADIADTILLNKTAGTGLRGSVLLDVIETITLANDLVINLDHAIRFERPTLVPIYITADIKVRSGFSTVDPELVKENIAKATYGLGQAAEASLLYAYGYSAGTTFTLTNMQISRDDVTYTDGELPAEIQERFTVSIDNIALTEI